MAKALPKEAGGSIFGGNFGFKALDSNDATTEKPKIKRQFPVATAASLSGGFPVFKGGFTHNEDQSQDFDVSDTNEDLTLAPSSNPVPFAAPAPAPESAPRGLAFSAVSAGIAIPLAHDQYAHMSPHTPHGYAPSVPSNTRDPNAEPLPKCAENNPKSWCLEDPEYPAGEIRRTLAYHFDDVISMYRDVKVATDNSVAGLLQIVEETYLCPSETSYIQPLRAINKNGQWRWIVNNIDAHYEVLTQTARIEECTTGGESCPLVPDCYETKCLQKSNYHRFLVYDRYDRYLPFAIESFKLPSSCACYNGAYKAPYVTPYKKA